MFELTANNAGEYLAVRGYKERPVSITELGGGVSNTVLLIESSHGRFVLKQALEKLRVEQDWFSDRSRAIREAEALRMLADRLPEGSIPAILFEDPNNCVFAMSAAPAAARTWKSLLLDGVIREQTAEQIARLQVALIRASWRSSEWAARLGDLAVFDQLRLDPYYRATARRHPDLAGFFEGLIADARERGAALTHGDWSPKNFLVDGDAVMAIDFEVIHFGAPTFDAAFLLNHLLLKGFHRPEWAASYVRAARNAWQTLAAGLPQGADWFEAGTIAHLGGLMLARIDGKSPVEYLRDEPTREHVRQFARELILRRPASIDEVLTRVAP
ncbi:MAG TPA: phosphotransferase [Bryobacteraceae bacterium]|nr:phosphotransferase [Bryobacteraceae bacterium]